MAVTSSIKKVGVAVKLNNGTVDGAVKTVSVSLGNMSESYFSSSPATADEKTMLIVGYLAECLTKPVYTVEKTTVTTLMNS